MGSFISIASGTLGPPASLPSSHAQLENGKRQIPHRGTWGGCHQNPRAVAFQWLCELWSLQRNWVGILAVHILRSSRPPRLVKPVVPENQSRELVTSAALPLAVPFVPCFRLGGFVWLSACLLGKRIKKTWKQGHIAWKETLFQWLPPFTEFLYVKWEMFLCKYPFPHPLQNLKIINTWMFSLSH